MELVGRSDERARLEAALKGAAAGSGALVVVEGEAGMGKSSLVGWAAERAAELGFVVHLGACVDLDRYRPYGPLLDALAITSSSADPARAAIAAGLETAEAPVRRSEPTSPEALPQQWVAEAVLGVLDSLSSRGAALLALDDLQWADPATVAVLHRAMRTLRQHRLVILLAARAGVDSPARPLLATPPGPASVRLDLQPLGEDDVADLVQSTVWARPGPNLAQLLAGAGGNPLYVTELLLGLRVARELSLPEGGLAEIERPSLAPTLVSAVMKHLSVLSPACLDLLRVAALLGVDFDVDELRLVTGRSAIELYPLLREALAVGALREEGDSLPFRHHLVREVLYDDLPRAVRAGMHLDVARALAEAVRPPVRVAEHFRLGARAGDQEAIDQLRRAAKLVAPSSPSTAVDLTGAALDLMTAEGARRFEVELELADHLFLAGRHRDGEVLCRRLLERSRDPAVSTELRTLLVRSLVAQARNAEALEEAETYLAQSNGRAELVIHGVTVAKGRLSLGDLDGAAAAARNAVAIADELGSPVDAAGAFMILALVDRVAGRFQQGVAHALDGLARVHTSEDPRPTATPIECWQALLLTDLGRFAEAEGAVEEGRRGAERAGGAANLVSFHFAAGSLRWWQGDWDDAAAEYQAGLELAQVTRAGWRMAAYGFLAFTALERDRLEEAEAVIAEADAHQADTGPQAQAQRVEWARARVLATRRDDAGAGRVLVGAWRRCDAAGIHGDLPVIGPDLVRLATAPDQRDDAVRATVALEALAERERYDGIRSSALLARGLLDDDLDTLRQAVEAGRRSGSPWMSARAAEAAGLAALAHGAPDAAAILDEASAGYDLLGAQGASRRVDAAARRNGLRRGARGRRGRPTSGWDSLTPTEQRVAELVAQGGSNPEIGERMGLSRRTVQTHVSHILAKLTLTSRVELATAFALR